MPTSRDHPDQTLQLRIVNAYLRHHPQVAEAIEVATSVVAKVQFPINSFQDMTEAMGGAQTSVKFAGRSFTLAELESQVPSYYFPIANENDLVAKLGDLSKRLPSAADPGPVLIPATAAAPSVPHPSMSGDELQNLKSRVPSGVAGIGGITR